MSEDDNGRRSLGLEDCVPSNWAYPQSCAVFAAVYRMFLSARQQAFNGGFPAHMDLGDVHLVAFRGPVSPTTVVTPLLLEPVPGQLEIGSTADPLPRALRSEGAFLVALVRVPPEPAGADEHRASDLIDEAVTVMQVVVGAGAVFERALDGVTLRGGATPAFAPARAAPAPASGGEVSHRTLEEITRVHQHLQTAAGPERARLGLALRWAHRAGSLTGGDALLAWWLALEALGMEEPGEVRSLLERLGEIYGLSGVQAAARFRLGRIHGLRNALLRGGDAVSVPAELLRYLDAVFADLFRDASGLRTGAVLALLNGSELDLETMLGS